MQISDRKLKLFSHPPIKIPQHIKVRKLSKFQKDWVLTSYIETAVSVFLVISSCLKRSKHLNLLCYHEGTTINVITASRYWEREKALGFEQFEEREREREEMLQLNSWGAV